MYIHYTKDYHNGSLIHVSHESILMDRGELEKKVRARDPRVDLIRRYMCMTDTYNST